MSAPTVGTPATRPSGPWTVVAVVVLLVVAATVGSWWGEGQLSEERWR